MLLQRHPVYGVSKNLINVFFPAEQRKLLSQFSLVSLLCAGASGSAGSESRAVPPPAGPGRVHAAGSRRRGRRAWYHPDPAEPGPAAEQVGQPQLQDGRPTSESFFLFCFFLLCCFFKPLELHTYIFIKPDRQSWMRPLPWQQVSRHLCRTPSTGWPRLNRPWTWPSHRASYWTLCFSRSTSTR